MEKCYRESTEKYGARTDLGTAGSGSRKRRKNRNPKGRDKTRARKIEETGRGEVLSRINGKIRIKDGPGKSRRDMAENKDSRQRNKRRNNGKEDTAEATTGASGHVFAVPRKRKWGGKASLLSGLICHKKDENGLKG